MMKVKFRRNNQRFWSIILGLSLFICGAGVVWVVNSQSLSLKTTKPTVKIVPQIKTISSNVLFLGNTFWGRNIEDWSMASQLKYAYPFSRLNEFNRDQYDAWISGLECPTVGSVHMTSAQQEEALQFNCAPEFLPEAAKWFTAFTLANNHTDNQGLEGFYETRTQLDANGIQYFGHYDPTLSADACEVISLPVKVFKDDNSNTTGKLPIALCAYHGVFSIPPSESVAEIEKYSAYMPVIAMPHMGAEYKSEPDQIKTDFYRSLIDAGADIVIGDHPHWIQTTESYNGRLIVYSMGNFMFDQQGVAELVRSAAIRVNIEINDLKSDNMRKWLDIGEACATFKDDCLDQAEQKGLEKLSAEYKFGVVGTNNDSKIVKPVDETAQADILQRLNWQSTMGQLQFPQGSL